MDFELGDINSICRVCMKSGDLQSIFNFKDRFDEEYEDLSSKLSSCCGIDIHIDDNLPHKICEVCSDALILAYDLKILCKTSDAFLKNLICNSNQKDDVEMNSYRKTVKDKSFNVKKENDLRKELLDTNEDVDGNYEYESSDCDTAEERDSQMKDDTSVNLQPEDAPVDATIMMRGRKEYKCYGCPKLLPSRWDRQLHEELECPLMPLDTIYKCRICSATAPDRYKFDNHIWRQHRGTSPPVEDFFTSLTNPVEEVNKSSRKKTQQVFMCEQCGLRCKTRQAFRSHCLTHKPKHIIHCKQCSFKTTNNFSYNCHMKCYHWGHEFLQCFHCTFKTHRKENLKMHMRRHTGERPYPCKICDYKGICPSNLKKHMITHTNFKGFQCKICEKCYARNKTLQWHIMRVHENKKMVYCRLCHTKYIEEEALKKHMQTKHNMTDDSM